MLGLRMKKYICIKCGASSNDIQDLHLTCECLHPLIGKMSLWGLFRNFLFNFDIILGIEIAAGSIINTLFLFHCDWSFYAKLLEAFCMGIFIVGVLKK